ncbi:hypothetical protein [Bacillus sp. OK048]|uniref:hypothetical protein n=1 Tax=Bacillus sp. OK048 TaxID=1882761 RepID=UPI00088185DD|nr:hypothetical protein [Bacillus sp. OK048]SDN90605.1 hypothetical protein SAMN05443253_1261 [Bacillus sp. OK048]
MNNLMNTLSFWLYAIGALLRGDIILRIDGRFILIELYNYVDCYMATAATYDCAVWNCYGTTKQKAKEMALLRLDQALTMDLKEEEEEEVVEKDGFVFYRRKK